MKTACSSRTCPHRNIRKPSRRTGCSSASSPSATPTRTCACCSGPRPPPASSRSLDGQRHAARRAFEKPKHLYQYFKQIFAQVTNPALDCIREELVTATETFIGSEGNLLDPGPHSCRMIRLDHPLLDNKQLAQLREIA
jgi:hypothetical protein